jgi:hypothetical protein
VGKDNAVVRQLVVGRQINRLIVAFNQPGVVIITEALIEDINQLFILMGSLCV